jgi:hypothetical protein
VSALDQAALIYLCVMGSASILVLTVEAILRMRNAFGIAPVLRLIQLQWWKWALREIDPMHEDVPYIVGKINSLERKLA